MQNNWFTYEFQMGFLDLSLFAVELQRHGTVIVKMYVRFKFTAICFCEQLFTIQNYTKLKYCFGLDIGILYCCLDIIILSPINCWLMLCFAQQRDHNGIPVKQTHN